MHPFRLTVVVLSLLAATAVSALWACSYRRHGGDALVYRDFTDRPEPHGRDFPVWHLYSFCSFRGLLGIERHVYQDRQFLTDGGVYRREALYAPRYAPRRGRGTGFSVYGGVGDGRQKGLGGPESLSSRRPERRPRPIWRPRRPAAYTRRQVGLLIRIRRGIPVKPEADP